MFLNAFRGRKLGFSVVRITLKWHNERDLFVSEDTFFGLLTVLTRRDGEWDTWNSNIPRSVLFLPIVCARCSLSFVAMTPCLLTGCLHKLVPWTGRTAKKQFRRYSAGAGHSWSFCQAIRIWISTWPPPSNHPPKGNLLIGRVWLGQQGCQECIASPVHEQQDAGLGPQLRHVDLRLCQKFNREARVVLQCADGELVKPGSSGHHRSSPRRRAW